MASPTASTRRRADAADNHRYSGAVRRDNRPTVTDLIPQRWPALTAICVVPLATAIGIAALHCFAASLMPADMADAPSAINLAADGGLGTWLTSTLLGLAAAASLVVYSLRRHRLDDYQGRYRVWLWAALSWLLLSVDESASLHEWLQAWLAHAMQGRAGGAEPVLWLGLYGAALLPVFTRLAIEMRGCRTSAAMLLASIAAFVGAAGARLVGVETLADRALVKESLEMAGALCAFWAMTVHARFVLLEAEGRLGVKRKRAQQTSAETLQGPHRMPRSQRRSDLEPVAPAVAATAPNAAATKPAAAEAARSPAPVAVKSQPLATPAVAEQTEKSTEPEATGYRKLSKSERRALRRGQDRG